VSDLWSSVAISGEKGPDVLGRSPILLLDAAGVVASHVNGGPTEARLLLCLGDHRVQDGGLKMPERMEMNVRRHSSLAANTTEGVAHGVGVRREDTGELSGEDEV
jgi:hypothetical protein